MSKAASFLSATCVSYIFNKFWTFKVKSHSWREMTKFFSVYGGTLILNVFVNKLVLELVPKFMPALSQYTFQLAWFSATGVSTVLNYIGQKYWVFKPRTQALPATTGDGIANLPQ